MSYEVVPYSNSESLQFLGVFGGLWPNVWASLRVFVGRGAPLLRCFMARWLLMVESREKERA